jgi:hypothetical protein
MADQVSNKSSKSSGYGKHSKMFWFMVYIVAAIVVYGLIYILFIHKTGGSGSGTGGGFNY